MFGLYRLSLAVAVLLYHMGVTPYGMYPGVAAVVGFLMVSGYAMAGHIAVNFPAAADIPAFYRDRLLRLYPQYLFYMAVAMVTVFALNWRYYIFQIGPLSWPALIANLALVPLDFHMFSDRINHMMLIPQAWTLGLEALFYLLLPWLLRWPSLFLAALLAAAATFVLAAWNFLDFQSFGYRLMPAPLLWFLAGVALQRRLWRIYLAIAGFTLACIGALWLDGQLQPGAAASVLAGGACGLVLMPLLARLRRRRFDDWCANVSYGVYLCHCIILAGLIGYWQQGWAIGLAVGAAILCGWGSWRWIERPVAQLRKTLRLSRDNDLALGQEIV